jgi:hypothetical protein
MKSTISPLDYLETHSQVIALNLKENQYITWTIDEVLSCLKRIITDLMPIRSDETATNDYLRYLLDDYSKENQSGIPKSYKCFIENWLFKSLDEDKTYVYAFNRICNKYNKDNPLKITLKDPNECLKNLINNRKQARSIQDIEKQKALRISVTDLSKSAFKKLFRDPVIADKFIKRLKDNEFIGADESWKGLSGNLSELLAAYKVIKGSTKGLLKPAGRQLTEVKVFYSRFGLPWGKNQYISEGNMRINPSPDDEKEFKRILSDII